MHRKKKFLLKKKDPQKEVLIDKKDPHKELYTNTECKYKVGLYKDSAMPDHSKSLIWAVPDSVKYRVGLY